MKTVFQPTDENKKTKLILQLNIPFCYRHCAHCSRFRCRYDANVLHAHIEAMRREIESAAEELQDFEITAISLEGGSPGLAAPSDLQELLRTVHRNLPLSGDVQISVQTMPGEYSRSLMQRLRDCGVNFWSIGLNTANAEEHFLLKRPYDFNALTMVDAAIRNFHLRDLSFELLYGIPGQTEHSWKHTLATALFYRPEHLTLLPFRIEPGTELCQKQQLGELEACPAETRAEFYESAVRLLTSRGYHADTVYDFSLEGKENRFRMEQLRGTWQLGIGYDAYTCMDGVSYRSGHSLREYLEHAEDLSVTANKIQKIEGAALLQKRLDSALILQAGADLQNLAVECNTDIAPWEKQLLKMQAEKKAEKKDGRWYLTVAGIVELGLP